MTYRQKEKNRARIEGFISFYPCSFMRDVLNGQITHRDKSLAGFSICYYRNSICLRLDMFASQTRDLSHIELARSDNISSLNEVKAYRVNEVDISTERKNRARIEGIISFYPCSFCRYKGLGLAHKVFDRSNAMLALSGISKFSAKNTTDFGRERVKKF